MSICPATAALVIAEMASKLALKNLSLVDELDRIADQFGHVATGQVSIRVTSTETIAKIMSGFREAPPALVAGDAVTFEDYLARPDAMKTDALIFKGAQVKVIVRPSGTEPKLKCYLQATGETKDQAHHLLKALKEFASATLNALQ